MFDQGFPVSYIREYELYYKYVGLEHHFFHSFLRGSIKLMYRFSQA